MKFGILGAGNIAHRFAAALTHEPTAELVAASCRTQQKAATFLAEVPCAADARAYGSHEELLADPRVDAIYLSLPHALHRTWAIAALRAGKAVLCEKPAMISADEMREVARVARDAKALFMEAMKPRFVPLYQRVLDSLPAIGDVVRVEASLCNDMLAYVQDAGTYHMTPGPGAGVLLDCGTYCASWIADLCAESEPQLTSIAGAERDGIDVYANARLSVGATAARLECAFDRAKPRQAIVVGTRGRIVIDELHRPQHATVLVEGEPPAQIDAPYEHDDFFSQIHHFVGLFNAGATESPVMPLAASVRCAQILDAVRAGFAVTPAALDVLAEQERVLRYPTSFGTREAFELGSAVRSLADDYDLGYVVRIVRESDGYDLFRWGADGKRPANYDYAEGKRQASLRLGRCSLWGWTQAALNDTLGELFAHGDMPVAGAFPLRVGESDERVATICVSGLHEGLDHELIVRALEKVLGTTVPAFPCATV